MMRFGDMRRRRRPSLTPMIDVVFLLLVFFMLAAQFGRDAAVPLQASAGGGTYAGPPRLVEVGPDGLTLNGRAIAAGDLGAALADLTDSPDDIVVLRGTEGADLQDLVDAAAVLARAGFARLAVVE